MRLFRRLRKLVSVPRLVVLLVVVAVAAGTLTAVHVTGPSGGSGNAGIGSGNAGILQPGSQGSQSQGSQSQSQGQHWWDPRGWFSSGAHNPASRVVPGTSRVVPGTEAALPSRPNVVRQAVAPRVRRVRELTGLRTQYSRTYELSDGRRQAVISAGPVNYRDAAGAWAPISTAVTRSSRAGFSFADTANVFGSYFSGDPSRLVRFELPSGGWLQTGLPGGRRVAPKVAGNEVTYTGILPGVTLSYAVSPSGLKESVVLASRSADVAGLRFTVTAGGGLRPGGLRGGATGWFRGNAPVPVLISPAPFMTDGRLPGGPGRAPVRGELVPVAQRASWDAARSAESVVLVPDRGWLDAPGRAWPVTVDPTITIAPAPCPPTTYGCAHNTFIESGANAGANFYNYGWQLKVGTGTSSVDRALVQFPIGAIPGHSQIDSADLNMYWDDSFYQGTASVQPPQTVQAVEAMTAWDPTTVTWNSNIQLGTEGMNRVSVFSTGNGASAKGAWPSQASTAAANGSSYRYDQDTTAGDTFTFVPQPLTEPGTYQVDEHYVASSSASSAAPVTVNYQGGSASFKVNQQSGSGGVWKTLGSEPFAAGTAGSAVVGDGTASATVRVEADGVRFTKFAQVTDASAQANQGLQGDRWDSFAVRNIVQDWISGTSANNGFVLKAANEALGVGGPEYERSGNFYTGETATYPQLVVTYGQLTSVTFNPITVIRDNGANLSWTPYVNSTGNPGDDLAGYQVYRSVFQSFTPSADTLVANVPAGTTSFDDTTSVPAPPTASAGNAFYYMIAVRTANGTVVPGPVQLVRLPVAGKTVAVIFATGTATLSSAQPTANLQSLFGFPWTETGNNGSTGCSTCYGTTRSVFTFGSVASAIPAGSRITLAQLKLWGIANNGASAANYQVHNITGSFTASNATWNSAANQFDATALDTGATGITSDPQAEWLTATSAIQSWLDTPASQHGLMVKLADETGSNAPQDQELWLTTGAAEQWLRPYLVVTYADPATAYEAPATPHVSKASSTYTTPVTVTDTTTGAWGTNWQLGYHWATPDGTIVSSGTSAALLPSTLNSGTGAALTATVTTPPTVAGGTRSGYQLAWDMYNKTNGTWASSNTTTPNLTGTGGTGTVPAAGQVTSVAETAETLGLEKYYQYTPMATGSGSALDNNAATGNTVWNYSPFSNPSTGFRTFVRLDYNSMDTSESSMGFGWSLQASTLTRLGTPLDFHPSGNPTSVTLTDGNGGSHVFTLNTTVTPNVWTSPAGFHYYLQSYAACNVNGKDNPAKAWLITAPDATKFYFDCNGYQTAVVDKNGNEADFSYSQRKSENSPEEFLDHITDPAHRQTLTLTYNTKGQSYTYCDSTTDPNLTNPDVVDQVATITDISGRQISLTYNKQGELCQMTDGANADPSDGPVWSGPAANAKVFTFGYDPLQGNKNVKLTSVTDPRNDTTCLYYYPPSAAFKWSLQAITSRRADPASSTGTLVACPTTPASAYETQFAYTALAPGASSLLPNGGVQTDVTDPLGHKTSYLTDTAARPVQVTDPVGRKTTLAWDSDNNLTTRTENNNAVTKWTWDPNTGYPLTMQDAANQASGKQYTYGYQYSLPTPDGKSGHVAFLTSATSPLGNTTTYGLDAFGNVKSVTKPDGNVSGATAGSYTTSYTYNSDGTLLTAKDPDGNLTQYPAHDPSGSPTQVTDARNNTVTFAYSPTGQVTSNTDAYHRTITTTQYDVFGRTGLVTTRKSATQNVYTAAPVYDGNGNVTTSYAPSYSATTAGAATTSVYNPDDQVTSTTTPPDSGTGTGPTTTKVYNNDDTLQTVTRPDAVAPAAGATAAQYTTTYAYYPDQKVQTVTDGLGNQTGYTYDNVGNTYQVTDPDKNMTTYAYDLDHRQQQVTDPNGNYTQTTLDADGRVTQSRDKNGNVTLSNYDASGQVIQQQVPVQAPGQPVSYATTQYAYDQAGNRTQVLSPLAVQNGYSLFSSPPSACTATPATSPCPYTRVTTYNPDNQVAAQQTPAGGDGQYSAPQVTAYSYDNNGRQSQVTVPPSNGDLPATGLSTTGYTYWDNGWPATSTDPRGVITSWDYAPDGQQSSRVLTSADGGMTRGMSWSYFPGGKLQQVTDNGVPTGSSTEMVDAGDAAASASGSWATGSCPAAPAQPLPQPGTPPVQPACGGPAYRTHPIAAAGSTTDAFTWHLNVPQSGQYTIYVKYPALPAGTTAATGADYTVTTNGTSSGGGTPVTVTGIDQTQHAGTSSGGTWVKLGEWQFNHRVSGQQVTLNPAGSTGAAGSVVVASAVEAVRDTTGITNTAVHGDSYTYDPDGNTTGITGTTGTGTGNTAVTIAATPDVLDRTSSITETWASGTVNTTSYTYDAASNIKTMTHTITAGGTTTTDQNAAYTWTNLNQLQNQTDGPVTGDSTQKTTAFTYTPAGQVQTQQQPSGNLITGQYTAAGQVYTRAECTNKTSPVIPAFPITSPTAITCGTGGQLVSADAYTYDVNSQQTQDLSTLMSADNNSSYLSHTWNDTYNPLGQLLSVSDGSTQTEAYQHDPQGNIISQTTGNTSAPATTNIYSRGLLQSSATSGQTSTYNYDPLGRLDTVTSGTQLLQTSTYDGFDNLSSHTQGSGSSAVITSYNYDPLNRVTSQTTGTNTTSYSYLGLTGQVSSETDPGNSTKTYGYTPGGTRLFQTTAGNPTASLNGTAYYSYNNHSDVEALTGPSGTPTATYGYTAYGSPVASMFTGADASNASPGPNVVPYDSYRFNAMQWDPGSGQYNMGFRNYQPGLGSFTTRDMYAGSGADMALTSDPFTGGAYAFGDANPISNIELDGHMLVGGGGGTGSGTGGLTPQQIAAMRYVAESVVPFIVAGARAAQAQKLDNASNAADKLALETIGIPFVDAGTGIAAGFFQALKGVNAISNGNTVGGAGDIASSIFSVVGGKILGKLGGLAGRGISKVANALTDAAAEGAPPRFIVSSNGTVIDREAIGDTINLQRQARHILVICPGLSGQRICG